MVATLIKSADAARKAFRKNLRYWQSFSARSEFKPAGSYDLPLQQRYWVSSERGVYLLREGQILMVVPVPCYGLAFSPSHFFLTSTYGHYTAVLKGDRQALAEKGVRCQFKELHGYQTLGSDERIHQAFCTPDRLWVANTGRNTLLQFNLQPEEVESELPLFYDPFGAPIFYDNHHVNSVAVYGDLILFVAYRAGERSLIGVLHNQHITGFGYRYRGVHDVFLTDDNFYFCDTFGGNQPERGGCLVDRHGPIDASFFEQPPGRIVRGIAGDSTEMLVGHSHKGERRKRFEGKGSLMVIRDRKVVGEIVLPCAQVYQVATYEGVYLRPPSTTPKVHDVLAMLRASLGPAIYEADVTPLEPGTNH